MYNSIKKSWFIPPQYKHKDIPPLLLGNFSVSSTSSYSNEHAQGFFHTGKYYLILQEEKEENIVHVIKFDIEEFQWVHSRIIISLPKTELECHRENVFNSTSGVLVHIIQTYPTNERHETVMDLYTYNIVDLFDELNGKDVKIPESTEPESPPKTPTFYNPEDFSEPQNSPDLSFMTSMFEDSYNQDSNDESSRPTSFFELPSESQNQNLNMEHGSSESLKADLNRDLHHQDSKIDDEASTPDLSLAYDQLFNSITCKYAEFLGHESPTLLISSYFTQYYESTQDERYNYLDFIKIQKDQLYHEKRLVLDFDTVGGSVIARREYTKDKIFFFKRSYIEDSEYIMNLKILECDYSGNFLYSYNLEYIESWMFNVVDLKNSNYIFLYNGYGELEDLELRVLKLENGVLLSINETKDFIPCVKVPVEYRDRDLRVRAPIKKFDRLVMPFYCTTRDVFHPEFYMAIDLSTTEVVHQIISPENSHPCYSVNWNNEEIGMTFRKDNLQNATRPGPLCFKMACNDIEKKEKIKSLKYLSRFAVLTSFTYNELFKANLPSSLFNYLGIEN